MAATRLFSLVIYNPGSYPLVFTGSYPRIFGAVARVTDFNPESELLARSGCINSQVGVIWSWEHWRWA